MLPTGHATEPALRTVDGVVVPYGGIPALTAPWRRELARLAPGGLVVLFARSDLATVAAYLACLETETAVLLADPGLSRPAVDRLLTRFQPELVVGAAGPPVDGYRVDGDLWRREHTSDVPVHEETAVLMMTSGSSGEPQVVRLSAGNVESNASAIADGLGIERGDRAITSLPLHYCYGLSVVNSHLARGASVVLTGEAPTGRRFWQQFSRADCTTFAGVPLAYEALWSLLSRDWPPTLRALTQAGGALRPERVHDYARLAAGHDAGLHVMYGQTEATARMSILDTRKHPDRIGTVGRAVSGGDFHIDDGEIVYRGPNVMLGYAGLRAELALGDELGGVLRTGDLGSLDADGFLTVRGRVKRIAKIAGRRVSLDEFEQALGGGVAAVAAPPGIVVYRTGQPAGDLARVCADLGLPTPCVRLRTVSELPRTGSGKVDYPELTQLATRGGA